MSSTSEKSSTSPSLLSAQTLVIVGIVWAVMALLFFLLFSVPLSQEEGLPLWYSIGTYVFECGAYLGAALVCLRNWQSPHMVSGRNVWLGIGLGMLFYFIGGVLFGIWELYFELNPDVSPADAFYLGSYVVLIGGMVVAVTSKRLNLEIWQWGLLAGIAAFGIAIAIWVAAPESWRLKLGLAPAPSVETLTETAPPTQPTAAAPALNSSKSKVKAQDSSAAKPEPESAEEETKAPAWVVALDKQLSPYAYAINLFYIVGDVFLLIIATALLLAFWGGRFSQSWRMIAAATFSLYVADMYFKWRDTQAEGTYQSGSLLEVFFVFSAILFGIGAILEHDISTRSRQSRRSRRAA
ncbi:hypothetical protein IQ270_14230 [Microcoleus sp. LEGE 07076]|uniref:hypothetical protein n=1 Tax=Microcoleus sp. LEGE 07076 TaxID=915322 RepID=UPI00187EB5E3|nr:hypothetical protein [Microcoleus sp. LEGE 07076]MBE9185824.1 hypothetical protein [Microcoleus sp. LEGE 07076]